MTKVNIAVVNLQSAVATTRGYFHYPFTVWRYWFPHSNKPIRICGQILKDERIDIACITEISEKSLRGGFTSQIKTLMKSSGLSNGHFFSSQKYGKLFFHEGNTVISNGSLSKFKSHLLPIEMMRMALEECEVEIDNKKITVFVAHLALGKEMRMKQIDMIIEIIKQKTGPIIFAGDFNEMDPTAFDELRSKTSLKQLFTLDSFPSWKPTKSFDYALMTNDFKVESFYIPKGKLFSDHLPLVVKAQLN